MQGPNFRIVRVFINATSYLAGQRPLPASPTAAPSAHMPDEPSDFGVRIAGVGIGLAVGLVVGGAISHVVTKARAARQDSSPIETLQIEHVHSEDLL
jgi:hypothetical protein